MRTAGVTLTAATTAAAIGACGSSSSGGSGKSASNTPVHIAFIYASSTQNAFQEMALGAGAAASKMHAQFTQAAPSSVNGNQEVQLFDSAMQNAKDGVAVETETPDEFLRPFSQAVDSGVPVISVDNPPLSGSRVGLYIGNSNKELGAQLATAILRHIPKSKHGYIVIGDDVPGLPVMDNRDKGIAAAIKAARPDLTVLPFFNSYSEPTANYNAWNSEISAHPNALAYLGPGDQDAVSIARVEQQRGRHYLVGATDVDPIALHDVQTGLVTALADPEHWLKGYIAAALLVDHARQGKQLPSGWWNPGSALITKANIGKIIARQKTASSRAAYYAPIVSKELASPSTYIKPMSQAN